MKTLAIETSCDDTSLAILEYDKGYFDIKKCILHSQIDSHRKYGGVVPELASRLHEEKIVDLLNEIGLDEINKVDFISYTCCPGLPGSLLVGKTAANTLSLFLEKEKLGIHHIHGHIFSIFAERNINDIKFPLLVLTVSGGHNDMYIIVEKDISYFDKNNIITDNSKKSQKGKNIICDYNKDNPGLCNENNILLNYLDNFSKNYNIPMEDLVSEIGPFKIYKIGMTLDDAAGEAFDKVSKMLGGPYPGGKWIYEKAKNYIYNEGEKNVEISFPRIYLKKNEFNFSFSGLKAQVNYKIQELKKTYGEKLSDELINKIAYEFQQAVIETLAHKLLKASKFFDIKNISLVGGVSSNLALKDYIQKNMTKYGIENFYTPVKNLYSTDNAAMIGVVGMLKKLRIKGNWGIVQRIVRKGKQ